MADDHRRELVYRGAYLTSSPPGVAKRRRPLPNDDLAEDAADDLAAFDREHQGKVSEIVSRLARVRAELGTATKARRK